VGAVASEVARAAGFMLFQLFLLDVARQQLCGPPVAPDSHPVLVAPESDPCRSRRASARRARRDRDRGLRLGARLRDDRAR